MGVTGTLKSQKTQFPQTPGFLQGSPWRQVAGQAADLPSRSELTPAQLVDCAAK